MTPRKVHPHIGGKDVMRPSARTRFDPVCGRRKMAPPDYFEVFSGRCAGRLRLDEVVGERDRALTMAQELMIGGTGPGVRWSRKPDTQAAIICR